MLLYVDYILLDSWLYRVPFGIPLGIYSVSIRTPFGTPFGIGTPLPCHMILTVIYSSIYRLTNAYSWSLRWWLTTQASSDRYTVQSDNAFLSCIYTGLRCPLNGSFLPVAELGRHTHLEVRKVSPGLTPYGQGWEWVWYSPLGSEWTLSQHSHGLGLENTSTPS